MKKNIFIITVILLLVCGCGKEKVSKVEYKKLTKSLDGYYS